MASKSKRTSSKSSRSSRSAKKTSRTRSSAKTSSRRGSGSRSSQKSSAKRQPPEKTTGGLSLDRKLDIIGVVMALIGFLTLLSLASSAQSPLTSGWIALLRRGFGLGAYILPITLLGLGVWLILRHFERIPLLSIERLLGLVLLFANLLTLLHAAQLPATRTANFALAANGQGGGYVGGVILALLQAGLGIGGVFIALGAWLLIALTMTFDVSVIEMFRWAPAMISQLQDSWDEFSARRSNRRRAPAFTGQVPEAPTIMNEITPLLEEPAPQVAAAFPSNPVQMRAWMLPRIEEILESSGEVIFDDEIDRHRAHIIEETLSSFSAPVNVVEISRGPTITMFGVEPDFIESRSGRTRVRVGKISSLADDLALALAARTIRIQAPVPGKGYVGIEVLSLIHI